ncbi:MAG: hypothetical protein AB7P34_01430 [Vicinamibacterales bacterium]
MTRIAAALIAIAVVVLLAFIGVPPVTAEQKPLPLSGQGIPRCDIPKAFGRLVSFLPGSDTGIAGQVTARSANGNILAGQAIFEAPDGTIRWVAVVAPANAAGTGKPALRVMPRNFPVLPIYECALGHVWQRP